MHTLRHNFSECLLRAPEDWYHCHHISHKLGELVVAVAMDSLLLQVRRSSTVQHRLHVRVRFVAGIHLIRLHPIEISGAIHNFCEWWLSGMKPARGIELRTLRNDLDI